ncbi:polynucleotide kinase 3 phosphatase-domain-containing protein, partial [Dimargaris cristalligena]
SVIIGIHQQPVSGAKIACFDLDNTLIKVKGTHTYSKSADDWEFLYDFIPAKLRQLVADGYKIAIISNQAGLRYSFDKGNPKAFAKYLLFRNKLNQIAHQLQIPFHFLAATQYDLYRKPRSGMWHFLALHLNDGIPIDLGQSFYVGDAAGRPHHWKRGMKVDFADTDRKFAENLRLPFHTPEEYFHGEAPAPFSYGEFHPTRVPLSAEVARQLGKTGIGAAPDSDAPPTLPSTAEQLQLRSRDQSPELVVVVGFPASGKSSIVERAFRPAGYTHVNQDTLKTRAKCVAACDQALQAGQSVVVDNTNPDRSTRAEYIRVAQRHNVPVRCLHLSASEDVARHNNIFRAWAHLVAEPAAARSALSSIVFNTYKSRFETPTEAEGFAEVVSMDFQFDG